MCLQKVYQLTVVYMSLFNNCFNYYLIKTLENKINFLLVTWMLK